MGPNGEGRVRKNDFDGLSTGGPLLLQHRLLCLDKTASHEFIRREPVCDGRIDRVRPVERRNDAGVLDCDRLRDGGEALGLDRDRPEDLVDDRDLGQ